MTTWFNDFSDAPYQRPLLVKNDLMEEPVLATRGYVTDIGVHPDQTYFTKYPSGHLVCPTQWAFPPKDD